MGGRLQENDINQLEQWIGTGPKTFTLLYSITRDGCNATTFHQKCDNQGATVTVLYNPHGSVYGGYARQSWNCSGLQPFYEQNFEEDEEEIYEAALSDNYAFLYQLHYSGRPVRRQFYQCNNSNDSIVSQPSYGPTFGNGHNLERYASTMHSKNRNQNVFGNIRKKRFDQVGHDLLTFTGNVINSGGYFALNGSMAIGTTFNNQGIPVNKINNGSMNVTELEVYRVDMAFTILAMGGRLQENDINQLEQWIGTGPKTFTLLYSITRDGCNATTFHQKCDNQGATVTVLYNPHGSVYGGYARQSWNCSGLQPFYEQNFEEDEEEIYEAALSDNYAFLYQLHYSGRPVRRQFYQCNNSNDSIVSQPSYGPTFGNGHNLERYASTMHSKNRNQNVFGNIRKKRFDQVGHDLLTFTGNVINSGGYFALNGSMAIGTTFNNQGIPVNKINNGSMNVTELEVYRVDNGKREQAVVTTVPWRKTQTWNEQLLDKLTKDVIAFKPIPELKIPQARILMIGPVGAGKSSFYNTINSIFKGRITNRACSGSAEQSLTSNYIQYEVGVRSRGTLNLRFCDTRGLEEAQGIDVLECNYLLEGNVPDYYEFNPASPIKPDTAGFISKPSAGDKIHCVAFVIDATTLEVMPAKLLEKMKSFQTIMNQKGIPQSILLTKVDKLCKEVETDVSNVFKSKAVMEYVEKASQILGLPRGKVLPVKNYENEVELEDNISILALFALGQMLNSAEDFMDNLCGRMKSENAGIEKLNIKD